MCRTFAIEMELKAPRDTAAGEAKLAKTICGHTTLAKSDSLLAAIVCHFLSLFFFFGFFVVRVPSEVSSNSAIR